MLSITHTVLHIHALNTRQHTTSAKQYSCKFPINAFTKPRHNTTQMSPNASQRSQHHKQHQTHTWTSQARDFFVFMRLSTQSDHTTPAYGVRSIITPRLLVRVGVDKLPRLPVDPHNLPLRIPTLLPLWQPSTPPCSYSYSYLASRPPSLRHRCHRPRLMAPATRQQIPTSSAVAAVVAVGRSVRTRPTRCWPVAEPPVIRKRTAEAEAAA